LKAEHETLLQVTRRLAPSAPHAQASRLSFALVLAACVWVVAWYAQTVWSTVAIWQRSDTYAHGFLILPISAWLIWSRRAELAAITPKPDFWGLAVLAGLGFTWLLGSLAVAPVVQQYGLVMMIPTLTWVILGRRMVLALLFPLFFLLFAVPVGDFLIPPLIRFTANFTVTALQLTGVPVYREGNFLSVPTGNWSVVEACSGLRYLIASVTLGCLYAYLTYRSGLRRLVFIALSIVIPVLANGFRAYMIVMIGHLSNMRLATGIDHYIYGWVFFGAVMLLLFWAGSFWRQDYAAAAPKQDIFPGEAPPIALGKIAAASLACAAVAAVWPTYADWMDARPLTSAPPRLPAPAAASGWRAVPEQLSVWTPRYFGASTEIRQTYAKGVNRVAVIIKFYRNQHSGSRLITTTNVLVSTKKDELFGNVGEQRLRIAHDAGSLGVRETKLRSPVARILVWDWYWIDGERTTNAYYGKWLQARAKLLRQGDDAAAVFIYAPFDAAPEAARTVLADFLKAHVGSIDKLLASASK
jgi:exosortase A